MADLLEVQMPTAAEAKLHPILWAIYASGGLWRPARHLWFLADILMKMVRGEILRLCVSMPPQHGKSEFISKYFPTWLVGHDPTQRILQISYGKDLTIEWTGKGRDLVAEHGPAVFGIDTWARSKKTAWDLYDLEGKKTGGSVRGLGVNGGASGRPADAVIIDDPIKDRVTANNAQLRQAIWEWLESVALTRIAPGGIAIVVATRWHHDDVIGRLIRKQEQGEMGEPWTFINIPAMSEGEGDPLGRPAEEGLWPSYYTGDWYKKKRKEVGGYVWPALYQGRPTPLIGALFKKAWAKYYVAGPAPDFGFPVVEFTHGDRTEQVSAGSMRRFATVDLAASEDSAADYTAMFVWGAWQHWLFLLDIFHDRIEGPDIVPKALALQEQWECSGWWFEKIGMQLATIQEAGRKGLPVRALNPKGDKVTRAIPATALMEQGRMWFPQNHPKLAEFEEELYQFPVGHDDQVDVTGYAAVLFSKMRVLGRAALPKNRSVESDPLDGRGGFNDD